MFYTIVHKQTKKNLITLVTMENPSHNGQDKLFLEFCIQLLPFNKIHETTIYNLWKMLKF